MTELTDHRTVLQANALSAKLIEWRRQFHQHPELSFQEFGTSRFVAETLKNIHNLKVETGIGVETSVVATLTSGEGPTIAIRADMDALPIKEENTVEYKSKHAGVMHACGHDAHTAILLGAAHLLASKFETEGLKGTVKFIFQPAEESTDEKGLSGSPYLVQAGAYDNVDAAIALHMCPWLPDGSAQVNDGYSMANVDVFTAKIFGTGGHGAYPELGTDPIWMLGIVMQALHGIVSRKLPALEAGVISIGQIHAGTASNIIPNEVLITGTIRSYTPEARDLLGMELKKALSIVEPLGGRFSLDVERGEPALYNDAQVNRLFIRSMKEMYPELQIVNQPFGMGGEDFGYVTKKLPGALFFLGSGPKDGIQRDLHTPIFDLDENSLAKGAAILTQTAVNFLNGESHSQNMNKTEVQVHVS
ncbi:M20 metallopeptidase family protein [Neobacillus jeddahensis]|uniref:M20 metallopeptidase family protein n=1 Tax=Neobacillus jeddahensis TaxID=1461580 RepID=UPI0005903C5D|nr:M20 family metallopeptidase [Neobacillus jeddahensis]